MFRSIEWLVVKSLLLRIVDDPLTRNGMRYKPVTSKLLRKCILATSEAMIALIAEKLPNDLAIVFDGWTVGCLHYIGISASYCSGVGSKEIIHHTLLSMHPLLKDKIEGMTARDHLVHILQVMQLYGKTKDNIICMIGNNCNVNKVWPTC